MLSDAAALPQLHQGRLRGDAGVAARPPALRVRAARRGGRQAEAQVRRGRVPVVVSSLNSHGCRTSVEATRKIHMQCVLVD